MNQVNKKLDSLQPMIYLRGACEKNKINKITACMPHSFTELSLLKVTFF